MEQKAWKFDDATVMKMVNSALLLMGGALLTYLADNGLQLIGAVGIPVEWQPTALAVFTWLINTAREFIKGAKNG